MGKLDGRVVLITGAARGQGEQEARLFAAEGANVVLADVLDEAGERLAEELGQERARYVRLDVSREDDWARGVEFAHEAFGGLDGLVNNAGILRFNALVHTPLEEYLAVVGVNQVGAFLGMRAAAPAIEAAGGGTIVNTSSASALTGMPFVTAYAATKAAVVGMTRVAALELAPKGIRVNAVCPGGVDTPMTNPEAATGALPVDASAAAEANSAFYAKHIPLGRIGRPGEVARLALFLSCDDSSYITGQPVLIDGGWLAGVQLF
ncbi:SDR family NAD(P)-dependent oxidoreductase [Wenjunlia tyrosinilytica]|uniref:3-alpha-hydroxysteroid dehydrogenase n=1 Tax=Wenjunlia tyrosinilytica TaxID=1544741 RepID=A0A917ZXU1_9ACTN|nr:glucose 1-dehydrogenase [Wenjunlia tyrosinilytica]GGP00135.1 3-alpha-hydroxysteroid dehydrogenase [Wenjunlia tyrosinilytica]